MPVNIVPSTPTHRVGETVDVVASDFGTQGENLALYLINGLDADHDFALEVGPYNGEPQTFSGVIIPPYPTSGGGETNTQFKVVDVSTLDEDQSAPFTLLPAAPPAAAQPAKLSLGIGLGL